MVYKRLKGSTVYIIGSMDYDRETGRAWREELTPFLESLGVIVYNPYKKPLQDDDGLEDDDNHLAVQEALKREDYAEVEQRMKIVRHVDLRMVDKADFIVAHLDWTKRLCGTIRELLEAASQQKPIIVHLKQPKNEQPPWLFSETDHTLWFTEWHKLKNYLIHINEDYIIDKKNKWVFFTK
jgi:nucleoside 2-deoxyribosyltransferase